VDNKEVVTGQTLASVLNSIDPDLGRFRARGGKLIYKRHTARSKFRASAALLVLLLSASVRRRLSCADRAIRLTVDLTKVCTGNRRQNEIVELTTVSLEFSGAAFRN
jgi:hypothetical protein